MNSESKLLTLDFYYKIINIMPYGMVVADKTGKFILWNNKSFPVFNRSNTNCTQEDWANEFEIYTIDGSRKYSTEELPLSKALLGNTVIGEKVFIKHEGIPEGMYLKISSFPIMNNEGTEIEAGVMVFDNITQEQLLYDSVIHKINELENYLKDVLNIDYDDILKNIK